MNDAARKLLPPPMALQSLAAAIRLGSFSAAGAEVGLTQSAVSRQIALLEDWLQRPLFERTGRRVEPTAEGRAYAAAIMPALEVIRRATAQAIAHRTGREFTIATLPSFGMRWLAPRLPRLTERYPDLTVNFVARSIPFPLAAEGFDAAIHFGQPDWPDVAHDLLFREQAIPVCAPSMLAAHPVNAPRDLLDWPLLAQSSRTDAWAKWFANAGLAAPRRAPAGHFEHFLMLAQAAAAGAGAALIPSFLIGPELAAGSLVCPIDRALSGEEAYYLVYPHDRLGNPHFRYLRDRILEEAHDGMADGSGNAGNAVNR
ncbi:LysR substrate-binding domain-containing protein [Sphingobium boeckii]|uniref:DNA-binding transcriptional LysR family regulator n=1 Tax=Sphingobium boeckii TaxID=1082345 RepID=A0A7W9ECT1_9SPHN|nr:LysR substrate-binding domain-containing protein [Sphingobium boeckii]MBB5684603.1 DNA-binding transcriptional LysR family regulator [Sphingobium boeckii]